MKNIQDQIGNVLEVVKTPKRIISLVPSLTELLVDLGLEQNLIGITKFCVHPKRLLKNKTIIGGTKTIKINRIKVLNPDIILCNKEENTKEIVAACQKIAPTHVSDLYTLEDTKKIIKDYGIIFNCKVKSLQMINQLTQIETTFLKFIKNKKPLRVAYFIWKKPWMVAGNKTFINHLLQLNKFENIYKNKNRYPKVDINNLPEIDYIFLSSEPYPFTEKHIKELKYIYPKVEILLVDGEMFSWYGSRLIKAFDYFVSLRNRL